MIREFKFNPSAVERAQPHARQKGGSPDGFLQIKKPKAGPAGRTTRQPLQPRRAITVMDDVHALGPPPVRREHSRNHDSSNFQAPRRAKARNTNQQIISGSNSIVNFDSYSDAMQASSGQQATQTNIINDYSNIIAGLDGGTMGYDDGQWHTARWLGERQPSNEQRAMPSQNAGSSIIGEIRIDSNKRNNVTLKIPTQIAEKEPGKGNLVRVNESGNVVSLHGGSNADFISTYQTNPVDSTRAASQPEVRQRGFRAHHTEQSWHRPRPSESMKNHSRAMEAQRAKAAMNSTSMRAQEMEAAESLPYLVNGPAPPISSCQASLKKRTLIDGNFQSYRIEQAQQSNELASFANQNINMSNTKRMSVYSKQRSRASRASGRSLQSRGQQKAGQQSKPGDAEADSTRTGQVRALQVSSRKLAAESYNQKRAHKIRDFLLAKKMNLDLTEYLARNNTRVRYGSDGQTQKTNKKKEDDPDVQSCHQTLDDDSQLRPPVIISDTVDLEVAHHKASASVVQSPSKALPGAVAKATATERLQQKLGIMSAQSNNVLRSDGIHRSVTKIPAKMKDPKYSTHHDYEFKRVNLNLSKLSESLAGRKAGFQNTLYTNAAKSSSLHSPYQSWKQHQLALSQQMATPSRGQHNASSIGGSNRGALTTLRQANSTHAPQSALQSTTKEATQASIEQSQTAFESASVHRELKRNSDGHAYNRSAHVESEKWKAKTSKFLKQKRSQRPEKGNAIAGGRGSDLAFPEHNNHREEKGDYSPLQSQKNSVMTQHGARRMGQPPSLLMDTSAMQRENDGRQGSLESWASAKRVPASQQPQVLRLRDHPLAQKKLDEVTFSNEFVAKRRGSISQGTQQKDLPQIRSSSTKNQDAAQMAYRTDAFEKAPRQQEPSAPLAAVGHDKGSVDIYQSASTQKMSVVSRTKTGLESASRLNFTQNPRERVDKDQLRVTFDETEATPTADDLHQEGDRFLPIVEGRCARQQESEESGASTQLRSPEKEVSSRSGWRSPNKAEPVGLRASFQAKFSQSPSANVVSNVHVSIEEMERYLRRQRRRGNRADQGKLKTKGRQVQNATRDAQGPGRDAEAQREREQEDKEENIGGKISSEGKASMGMTVAEMQEKAREATAQLRKGLGARSEFLEKRWVKQPPGQAGKQAKALGKAGIGQEKQEYLNQNSKVEQMVQAELDKMNKQAKAQEQKEKDMKLQTRVLDNAEMEEYWTREFVQQLQRRNVSNGVKILEDGYVQPGSDDVAKALIRYQRVFGEIYSALRVQQILSKTENKDLRDMIEHRFIAEIVKNMDRFLGMSFRQYATTIGVLNENNIEVFKDLKQQRMDEDDADMQIREELLTKQIKHIDEETKFAARVRRHSELLKMSADDLMESIRHLVDSYRSREDCTPEERYLLNLCQNTDIKPGKVASALHDKLLQDRKDKSFLQGKYENLYKIKNEDAEQSSQEAESPAPARRSKQTPPKSVKFGDRSALKAKKGRSSALSGTLGAKSQSPQSTNGSLKKQYRRSNSGQSLQQTSRLEQAVDLVTSNLEARQRAEQEKYREDARRLEELHDPALAKDAAQLVDDNLELILCSSEVHEHIEESMKGKRDMDFVKALAQDMMADMEGKAAAKRQAQLKKVREARRQQILQQFLGSKVDFLVRKFVANLRAAVQKRKDKAVLEQTEGMIEDILKEHQFKNQFKKVDVGEFQSLDDLKKKKRQQLAHNAAKVKISQNLAGAFATALNLKVPGSVDRQKMQATNDLKNDKSVLHGMKHIEEQVKTLGASRAASPRDNQLETVNEAKQEATEEGTLSPGSKMVDGRASRSSKPSHGGQSSTGEPARQQRGANIAEAFQSGGLAVKVGGGTGEPLQRLEDLAEGRAIVLRKTDQIFKKLGKAVESASMKAKQEQQKYQQQMISKQVMSQYIALVLKSGGQPLPVLNRISADKELFLLNYSLNASNVASLSQSFPFIVPFNLLKLFLIGNSMDDESAARVFEALSENHEGGLTQIGILKNGVGEETLHTMAEKYLKSEAARWLKRLIFKSPLPTRARPLFANAFFLEMAQQSKRLRMAELTLSGLHLHPSSMPALAEAVRSLVHLRYLDISENKLDARALNTFLKLIHRKNSLRYLSIAFNMASQKGQVAQTKSKKKREAAPTEEVKVHEFFRTLAEFLHLADSLLMIDLSGLGFDFLSTRYVVEHGLRKAHVLNTCVMKGLNVSDEQRDEILGLLRYRGKATSLLESFVRVDEREVKQIFDKEEKVQNQGELLAKQLQKQFLNYKIQSKKIIKQPALETPLDQQLVFERFLGHPEIVHSHRWSVTSEPRSYAVRKPTYAIFVWNESLHDHLTVPQFYTHESEKSPIAFDQTTTCPVLQLNLTTVPMVPVMEFIERLRASQRQSRLSYRSCNNEQEAKNREALAARIESYYRQHEQFHPTFWDEVRELLWPAEPVVADVKSLPVVIGKPIEEALAMPPELQTALDWASTIESLMPEGAFQPINLQEYATAMKATYRKIHATVPEPSAGERFLLEKTVANSIMKETYVAATLLDSDATCLNQPKSNDGRPSQSTAPKLFTNSHQLSFFVQHPAKAGIYGNTIDNLESTLKKSTPSKDPQFRVSRLPIKYKQLKKMRVIRNFHRPTSVFREYREETKALLGKAFECDKQYLKTPKFVKDKQDLEQVEAVLGKYFRQLKDQFGYQIATCGPDAYPAIGWLEYVEQCWKWRLLGPTLTQQDVDRSFIATNFEEVDLEENDDKSLCRYESLEILVRLAKIKYFDRGTCPTVAASLEKLLVEHILPHHGMPILGQEFRDEQLWTLEIDDLYKANYDALNQVYRAQQQAGEVKGDFTLDDSFSMMEDLGYFGSDHEKKIMIAFVLSKNLIVDEMEEFDNYNRLTRGEFNEFLGRAAYLLLSQEDPGVGAGSARGRSDAKGGPSTGKSGNSASRNVEAPYDDGVPLIKKIEKLLQQLIPTLSGQEFVLPDMDRAVSSSSDYEDDLVEDEMTEFFTFKR